MHYSVESTVCDCGSKSFHQMPMRHDIHGTWQTREWWKSHPEIIRPSAQKAAYIGDPTYFTCSECEKELNAAACKDLVSKIWAAMPRPIVYKEEIGIGIINPRGLKNGSKSIVIK